MFSNIASYIFGGEATEEGGQGSQGGQQQQAAQHHPEGAAAVPNAPVQEDLGSSEEDWVLVGNGAVPRTPQLTLGSLNEINPRPSTGSTGKFRIIIYFGVVQFHTMLTKRVGIACNNLVLGMSEHHQFKMELKGGEEILKKVRYYKPTLIASLNLNRELVRNGRHTPGKKT